MAERIHLHAAKDDEGDPAGKINWTPLRNNKAVERRKVFGGLSWKLIWKKEMKRGGMDQYQD